MEIEKQELIVHARETASKALKAITGKFQLPLQSSWAFFSVSCIFFFCNAYSILNLSSDRQISDKMALDAKKRQQLQKLKEQFAKDLEVLLSLK